LNPILKGKWNADIRKGPKESLNSTTKYSKRQLLIKANIILHLIVWKRSVLILEIVLAGIISFSKLPANT
jgi:hypothetical protein